MALAEPSQFSDVAILGTQRRSQDFPRCHFHLCSDGDLLRAFHTGRTSPGELRSSKARYDGEFKGIDSEGTLYHARSFLTRYRSQ
jgi:hypothetical protein